MVDSFTEKSILALPNVSRETFERMSSYVNELLKWNQHINLVGPMTEKDVWERHILDSAQLLSLIPPGTKTITDFGTGAGLPGMILALTGQYNVHLVESNKKKISFLRHIASLYQLPVTIHDKRIESLDAWESDILTARALASLPDLLDLLAPFIAKSKLSLFLKGQNVVEEIKKATTYWDFDVISYPSIAHNEGVILAITDVRQRVL
jgi:16S rRNA (guanine527-N7)-methyltransferase